MLSPYGSPFWSRGQRGVRHVFLTFECRIRRSTVDEIKSLAPLDSEQNLVAFQLLVLTPCDLKFRRSDAPNTFSIPSMADRDHHVCGNSVTVQAITRQSVQEGTFSLGNCIRLVARRTGCPNRSLGLSDRGAVPERCS